MQGLMRWGFIEVEEWKVNSGGVFRRHGYFLSVPFL